MEPEVQAFLDKWAEKSAAKQIAMAALGAAKLADHKAAQALTDSEREAHQEDAEIQWAILEAHGMAGDEGRLYAEAFEIAEAYVDAHPELRALSEQIAVDHDFLVKLIGVAGTDTERPDRLELAAKLTMFELVHFDRQHIGAGVKVTVRRKAGV